jgi:hypothetical protein
LSGDRLDRGKLLRSVIPVKPRGNEGRNEAKGYDVREPNNARTIVAPPRLDRKTHRFEIPIPERQSHPQKIIELGNNRSSRESTKINPGLQLRPVDLLRYLVAPGERNAASIAPGRSR